MGWIDRFVNGPGVDSIVNESTRDTSFWVALRGQPVTVTTRSGTSGKSLSGNLAGMVHRSKDSALGYCEEVAGILVEEAVQKDGTANIYFVPVDEIALVGIRVLRSSTR